MPELATVEVPGVEVARAGGPVKGYGTGPGGDTITVEELRRIARDTNEIIDELDPVSKLGHDLEQEMVKNSKSFFAGTDAPALGVWRNFRVEGDRLLADWKQAPRKFVDLVRAGAYKFRSWETVRFQSQRTQKQYPEVVSAVSWLGARRPAIRGMQSLDDVLTMYADDAPDNLVRSFVTESGGELGEVVEERADTRGEVPETKTTYELTDEQAKRLGTALGLPEDELTVEKILAAADQVEIVDESEEKSTETKTTETKSTETKSASDDEDDDSGDDEPEPKAKKSEARKSTKKAEETDEEVEPVRSLSESEYLDLKVRADAGASAAARLGEIQREEYLLEAARKGKIPPGKLEDYRRLYAEDETIVRSFVDLAPENEEFARVFGSDESSGDDAADEALSKSFHGVVAGPES